MRVLLFIVLVILIDKGYYTHSKGHSCPFESCPYLGMEKYTGVIETGSNEVLEHLEGTDVYCLDKLHWEYPTASYDELEEKLYSHH